MFRAWKPLIEKRGTLRIYIYLLVLIAGFAALSWEVVWQLKTSLALGISSHGTAITLATTMGGMSLGSIFMGRQLKKDKKVRPLFIYASLEFTIGLSGLLLRPCFQLLESLDTFLYAQNSSLSPIVHLLGSCLILGLPALAMGATLPVLGLVAQQRDLSLPRLYSLNTAGAALGCLFLAFSLLPSLGIQNCIYLIASLNFLVAALAYVFSRQWGPMNQSAAKEMGSEKATPAYTGALAFITGCVTFALEVAWFRALRSVFFSTSESFAIMLAAVLIALAVGAHLASFSKVRAFGLERVLLLAGMSVLLATPLIERLETITARVSGQHHLLLMANWFGYTLLILGPPILFTGMVLPWLLELENSPKDWSRLYGLNTVGAVVGSVSAAWLVLPYLGFARTSWLAGIILLSASLWVGRRQIRIIAPVLGILCLLVASHYETGIGRDRIQGRQIYSSYSLLRAVDTPDCTISVIEVSESSRVLVIDGFATADTRPGAAHYMPWMGRLPMLLHPDPTEALVICFGTGQTLNAVRREGATRIDLVDLNAAVLGFSGLFQENEGVLKDDRVSAHIMDGRAWMRRAQNKYDIITLEPMPPNFAGVNSLYSLEFYEAAKAKLKPNGVVAQWLPFSLVAPYHSTSIARTFQEVFPNSALWLDPVGFTGILVGSTSEVELGQSWPGFQRAIERDLSPEQVRRSLILDSKALSRYANSGILITDDNQLLNHGMWRLGKWGKQHDNNLAIVHWASTDPPPKSISPKEIYDKLRVDVKDLKKISPFAE